MNTPSHPVELEELMAYLEGELGGERASQVAQHVEECAVCRADAAEWRTLSEKLAAWQVEPSPRSFTEHVALATAEWQPPTVAPRVAAAGGRRFRFPVFPRWAWAVGGAVGVLMVVALAVPLLIRPRMAVEESSDRVVGATAERMEMPQPAPTAEPPAAPAGISGGDGALAKYQQAGVGGESPSPVPTAPMIARTASLTLETNDFDKARMGILDVIRRHRGYSAQLTVSSEAGNAHTLSATFHVPADQLDAAMAEIKQLAQVDQESQGGEEVTDQFVDLTARLSNARRTEQVLLDLLDKRTGKLSDVLEVEQELSRVREEIERMDAQMKALQNRVSFATLQVELHEEYKAHLELAPSIGRRLWNGVVEGFRNAADSLVGLIMFLLNVGPFLLLWGLILVLPIRYVWRHFRAKGPQR